MQIKIGNQSGKYFNPETTDEVMKPLAEIVANAIKNATDFHIYYDENQDFHHLTFNVSGKKVDVRFYKVIGYSIDGRTGKWDGCPLYKRYDWASYVAKELQN